MTQPLDPSAAVRAALVAYTRQPDIVFTPQATEHDLDPEPVTIPGRAVLVPDLAQLPAALRSADGQLVVPNAVALLWALLGSMEIRSVSGSVTVTTDPSFTGATVWPAGATIDRSIVWTTPAPSVPTGVLVRGEAGILGAGKTVADPIPGTVTATGCTIRAKNVSGGQVVVTAAQPITYIAQALYLWTPPLEAA